MSNLNLYIIDAQIVDAFLDVMVNEDDKETRRVIKGLLKLASVIKIPEKEPIPFQKINDLVKLNEHLEDFCSYNNISIDELQSKSRKSHLVKLRIAFYRDLRQMGFDSGLIAKTLNRHHSTMANYFEKPD